jgi:hypothetical protein
MEPKKRQNRVSNVILRIEGPAGAVSVANLQQLMLVIFSLFCQEISLNYGKRNIYNDYCCHLYPTNICSRTSFD